MKNIRPRTHYGVYNRVRKFSTLLFFAACFYASDCYGQGDQTVINVPVNSSSGYGEPALLHLPDDYSSTSTKYPLIIFFHGTGESGTNLSKIYNSTGAGGPAYFIAHNQWPSSFTNPKDGKKYKFIVVSPQAGSWSTNPIAVNYILTYLIDEYRVDVNRIYITGLSAGGQTTWYWVSHIGTTPNHLAAAIVPMSMATTAKYPDAANITADNIYAWGFGDPKGDIHGLHTMQGMDSLNKYAPGHGRFTSYTGGHCCWNQFYTPDYTEKMKIQGSNKQADMNIYEWMLQFTRGIDSSNQSPSVDAGKDQNLPTDTVSTTLEGTATDAGGSIVSYAWKQESGPSSATIKTDSAAKTDVTDLTDGTYVFSLTVTDNDGATATDDIEVKVKTQKNKPPVARISASSLSIILPIDLITLNGSSSSDPDGTIDSYNWSVTSGPSQYNILNTGSAITIVNSLVKGTYTVLLKVTDDKGATATDSVNVSVQDLINSSLIASILNDNQKITLPQDSVILDGSASTDSNGTISSFSWEKISGPSQYAIKDNSNPRTVANNLATGTYDFLLTVTDDKGATATDTLTVNVQKTTPPKAKHKKIFLTSTDQAMYYPNLPGSFDVQPGDTLCIAAGDYEYIQFGNIHGTKDEPIVIQNCGGLVRVGVHNTEGYTFVIHNSSYFELSGAGEPGLEYGFEMVGTPASEGGHVVQGIMLDQKSDNFDLHNIYINGTNGTGIECLTRAICSDPSTWRQNYTIQNLKFHHIKMRNTGLEGFYIGRTADYQIDASCSKDTLYNPLLENVEIYDNEFDSIGWDAIQLSLAYKGDNKIYDNKINYPGVNPTYGQGMGILIGGNTHAEVYDNIVNHAQNLPIQVLGSGLSKIYNNIICNSNTDGLQVGGALYIEPAAVDIFNNTFVNIKGNGIVIWGTQTDTVNRMYNNLFVNIEDATYQTPDSGIYIPTEQTIGYQIKFDLKNNIFLNDVDDANFVDAANDDYHLTDKSPVVDAGADLSAFGVTTDYDGTERPYGKSFDVGAFEYTDGKPANKSPVANAGKDVDINLPDDATLDGSASSDPDGSIATYSWKLLSGSTGIEIQADQLAKTTVSFQQNGTYVFQLTVTDDKGATSTDNVSVNVVPSSAPPNQSPVANAGANQKITLPDNSVDLDGTSSKDADGNIASYSWEKILGPSQYNIQDSASAATKVSNLTEGTYVFSLTVKDNDGATSSNNITITVNAAGNQAPVADAGSDQKIILPDNSIDLDGTSSKDADGNIASYSWKKISGPSQYNIQDATSATTKVSNLTEGTYVFSLTVKDNDGATSSNNVTITVNAAANEAPVANAGKDNAITLPVNSVQLNASASFDADGNITDYVWKKISGPSQFNIEDSSAAITKVDNLTEGTYQFSITVTDNDNATGEDTISITVKPASNQPPVANAGKDIVLTEPDSSTTLDGSASTDADGTIVNYKWTKTSGPSAYSFSNDTAAITNVNNLSEGKYIFELTVTDDKNSQASNTVTVIINPAADISPVAVANDGNNVVITLPLDSVTLDGSASSDSDGSITQFKWIVLSGPDGYLIQDSSASKTQINQLQEGIYILELTVTDDKGAQAITYLKITVNAAPHQSPVARAGSDQSITLPQNNTSLDGSASKDPDGNIENYTWKKISGPSQFLIKNSNSAMASVDNLIAGTYVFSLTVTDDQGASATDSISVQVNKAANELPQADAGNNISITLPDSAVTLSGSASSDDDGNIASYQWIKISGPTQYNLSQPDSEVTNASNLAEGTYSFQLIVTDNDGAQDSATVTVNVDSAKNIAPVAVANGGENVEITLPVNAVNLDGSTSSDADGNIAQFTWMVLFGPDEYNIADSSAAKTVISNLQQGKYLLQLTVTDNNGATATTYLTITVKPALNKSPYASAGDNVIIALPLDSVTLNGDDSYDPDGSIIKYEWAQIAGTTVSLINPNAALAKADNLKIGTYQFKLTVTDNKNAQAADIVTITVNPAPNKPPVANAGANVTITLPLDSVTLNGKSSEDPDGNIIKYVWTQIAGSTVSLINANTSIAGAENLKVGTYQFKLTVTDDKNVQAADIVTITVNPAPNKPPVADAGADAIIVLPDDEITFSGNKSYDPDGKIVSYEWVKTGGPAAFTLSGYNTDQGELSGLVAGTYTLKLTVTDDKGATASDIAQVIVKPKADIAPVADAGLDTTIELPQNNMLLDGSHSYDGDDSIVNYSWQELAGSPDFTMEHQDSSVLSLSNLSAGNYLFELTVTDAKGVSAQDEVSLTVNLSAEAQSGAVILYPNPASNYINIFYYNKDDGKVLITIYNMLGKPMGQYTFIKEHQSVFTQKIDISNLVDGMYIMKMDINNFSTSKKFIKSN